MDVYEVFDIIKRYINISVQWEKLLQEISDAEKDKIICSSESRIASLNNQKKLSKDLHDEALTHEKNKKDKLSQLNHVEAALNIEHQKYISSISTLDSSDLNDLYMVIQEELLIINKTLESLTNERNDLYRKAEFFERTRRLAEADDVKEQMGEKYKQFDFLSKCIQFYKSFSLDIKDRLINFNSGNAQKTY